MSVLFVSLDIFFEFLNGKDIFGFEGQPRRLSGPFGDELIAGDLFSGFHCFPFFLQYFLIQIVIKKINLLSQFYLLFFY